MIWGLGLLGFVLLLIAWGAAVDWRARRRGHWVNPDGMGRNIREHRRNVRAWERAAQGQGNPTLFWKTTSGKR